MSDKISRTQRIKELVWASEISGRKIAGDTLEIGGGKGYVANLLNDLGCRTIGLDIKLAFVKQMVKMKLPCVQADARQIPFKSSVFDQVTCFEMIEHVDNPEDVLKEIQRTLADKGFVILTTPLANPINNIIDFLRGEKTHVSVLRLNSLLQVLGKHFKKIRYRTILALPIPPRLFGRYFWLETRILANHIWVCCEK